MRNQENFYRPLMHCGQAVFHEMPLMSWWVIKRAKLRITQLLVESTRLESERVKAKSSDSHAQARVLRPELSALVQCRGRGHRRGPKDI